MSIQERQDVVAAPRHEFGEVLGLTFAGAADLSSGLYDTPEQQADRRVIAERLEAAMQPGATILHQVDRLDVRGGILLEPPSIVSVPLGKRQELAIGYTMWRDNAEQQGVMSMVRHGFVEQWDREHQPGGLHWADTSDTTQLYMFGALADTDVRLSDVVAETLIINHIAAAKSPRSTHAPSTRPRVTRHRTYNSCRRVRSYQLLPGGYHRSSSRPGTAICTGTSLVTGLKNDIQCEWWVCITGEN